MKNPPRNRSFYYVLTQSATRMRNIMGNAPLILKRGAFYNKRTAIKVAREESALSRGPITVWIIKGVAQIYRKQQFLKDGVLHKF